MDALRYIVKEDKMADIQAKSNKPMDNVSSNAFGAHRVGFSITHPIFGGKDYNQPGRIGYANPYRAAYQKVRHDYINPSKTSGEYTYPHFNMYSGGIPGKRTASEEHIVWRSYTGMNKRSPASVLQNKTPYTPRPSLSAPKANTANSYPMGGAEQTKTQPSMLSNNIASTAAPRSLLSEQNRIAPENKELPPSSSVKPLTREPALPPTIQPHEGKLVPYSPNQPQERGLVQYAGDSAASIGGALARFAGRAIMDYGLPAAGAIAKHTGRAALGLGKAAGNAFVEHGIPAIGAAAKYTGKAAMATGKAAGNAFVQYGIPAVEAAARSTGKAAMSAGNSAKEYGIPALNTATEYASAAKKNIGIGMAATYDKVSSNAAILGSKIANSRIFAGASEGAKQGVKENVFGHATVSRAARGFVKGAVNTGSLHGGALGALSEMTPGLTGLAEDAIFGGIHGATTSASGTIKGMASGNAGTGSDRQSDGVLDSILSKFTHSKYGKERHAFSDDPNHFGKPYNFVGPGTELHTRERLKDNIPLNALDAAAKTHDYAYKKEIEEYHVDKDLNRHMNNVWNADKEFIHTAANNPDDTFMGGIASNMIKAKMAAEKSGLLNYETFSGMKLREFEPVFGQRRQRHTKSNNAPSSSTVNTGGRLGKAYTPKRSEWEWKV